jgi:hypothetical protein
MGRGIANDKLRGLTPERVSELFNYDPETGVLSWKRPENAGDGRGRNWGKRAGYEINSGDGAGYRKVEILEFGRSGFLEHRLIWVYMTGHWPTDQVDHRNLVKNDNRWANLREASNVQNQANRGLRPHNSSGRTGVSFHPSQGKWHAELSIGRKRVLHAYFHEREEAIAAREAALVHHGQFAHRTGPL